MIAPCIWKKLVALWVISNRKLTEWLARSCFERVDTRGLVMNEQKKFLGHSFYPSVAPVGMNGKKRGGERKGCGCW